MKMRIIVIVKRRGVVKMSIGRQQRGSSYRSRLGPHFLSFSKKRGRSAFFVGVEEEFPLLGEHFAAPHDDSFSTFFSFGNMQNACHGRKDTRLSFLLKFAAGRLPGFPPPHTPL
ncbi:hypothetical protein CDAR_538951 [Caerostris darwini]|uniref:Uncharacterized protein n=1 Tax=Caerostris darwini TaxID=1538125 RepID=A0AAV4T495_9ARAC|nr:hypothetical protein CDAR_538951 [Caerostris darwini]